MCTSEAFLLAGYSKAAVALIRRKARHHQGAECARRRIIQTRKYQKKKKKRKYEKSKKDFHNMLHNFLNLAFSHIQTEKSK